MLGQDSLHSYPYTQPDHRMCKDWLLSGGELREQSILSPHLMFLHWKLPMEEIVKSTWKIPNLSSLKGYSSDLGLGKRTQVHRPLHKSEVNARAFLGSNCASSTSKTREPLTSQD